MILWSLWIEFFSVWFGCSPVILMLVLLKLLIERLALLHCRDLAVPIPYEHAHVQSLFCNQFLMIRD